MRAFRNPRLAAVIAEEFELSHNARGRRTLIGPTAVPLDHVGLATSIATSLQRLNDRNGDGINSGLFLAADFLERASDPSLGHEINEGQALRWAALLETENPVNGLDLAELGPSDIEALSLQAWLWLASSLGDREPELPTKFAEHLFAAATDPITRLFIANSILRHPRLAGRYLDATEVSFIAAVELGA